MAQTAGAAKKSAPVNAARNAFEKAVRDFAAFVERIKTAQTNPEGRDE